MEIFGCLKIIHYLYVIIKYNMKKTIWISQKDVKSKYNTSSQNLYTWRNKKGLIYKEIDGVVMYDEEDLKRFIKPPKTPKVTKPTKATKTSKKKVVDQPITPQEGEHNQSPPKKEEYNQGLDSEFILNNGFGYAGKFKTQSQIHLEEANRKFGCDFNTWDEFSKQPWSEEQVDKIADKINWYTFLKFNKDRSFSVEFQERHRKKFLLIKLGCIN